jgi:glycosyltransferase involved in cell wall biosynthesis
MKVLCLIDSPVRPGDNWIWDYIANHDDQVDFVSSFSIPRLSKALGFLGLGRFVVPWILAMKGFAQTLWKDYDLIVAWESKTGLPLAILRTLFRQYKPKLVILAFHVRGLFLHLLTITRNVIKAIDHVTVPTTSEVAYYAELLDLPRCKVSYCPLGGYDPFENTESTTEGEAYVFSGGGSYRDYATLAEAVLGLDVRIKLFAPRRSVKGLVFPSNVEYHDLVPAQEFYSLVKDAHFVVLPLQNVPHGIGLGHILCAMAGEKAVVATKTSGTADYVDDGQTGILVAPGDARDMREAIAYLVNYPEEARRMGQNARGRFFEEQYTFAAFAQRIYVILQQVCGAAKSGNATRSPKE